MSRLVLFHPEAELEFNESVIWYKNQQKALNLNLQDVLMRLLKK